MCGVVAAVARPGSSFLAHDLERAGKLLEHRGPDGHGHYFVPFQSPERVRVGLAHTRLAILDLRHEADQPMHHRHRRISLVYNGELYNYRELRAELVRKGHRFSTSGDTEVLLACYAEWGGNCLERLKGMYGFVIFDEERQVVFAARDPFGIKPLYMAAVDEGWILASEIKAITSFNQVSRDIGPEVLLRHIRFGISAYDEDTIFRQVHQLRPGQSLEIDLENGDLRFAQHYELPNQVLHANDISFGDAATELRRRFLNSVSMHMQSDVPLGTALSGGIDSAAVLVAMRETSSPDGLLNAFTFTSPGSPLDERKWADMVASQARANLVPVQTTGEDLISELTGLARSWDTPLAGTSVFAQYHVFKKAREHGVTVMLDGQGADEILGGYLRYVSARVASLMRNGQFVEASQLLRRARQRGLRISTTLAEAADCLLPSRIQNGLRRVLGRELTPSWVDSRWFEDRHATLAPVHSTREREVLREQLRGDVQLNLLPHLLRYEDTNSMLWSIESRVPYLDRDLVEFCLSLPEQYLISPEGETKSVFRSAMRGLVPDAILDRRDKIGFEPPRRDWLSQASRGDMNGLGHEVRSVLPFLHEKGFEKLWEVAENDRRAAEAAWRLIFLAEWSKAHDVSYT